MRRLTAPLLILLLALAAYGSLLRPGHIPFSVHSDVPTYHLAAKEVLYRSVQAGHGIPFWRDDQLAGSPAFTNPNSLYTNPLHLLFYLLPPPTAIGPTLWLHALAAGLSYLVAAAALGLGWWARLLVGAAGLLQFKLIISLYAGWLSVLPSLVALPLLFAAVVHLVESPGARAALGLALAGAFALHAGHLQLVYYAGWLLAMVLVVGLVHTWRKGARWRVRATVGWTGAGLALALGLAAYLLVPLAAEAVLTSRAAPAEAFWRRGQSLGLPHLLTFLYPEALGTPLDGSYARTELWEDVAYFGLLPLILAAVGAWAGRGRWQARGLAWAFLGAVACSFDTPILDVLYGILPGYRLFRLPGRMLFISSMCGILLAGIGLDELLSRHAQRATPRWRSLALALAALTAVSAEGVAYARQYVETVRTRDLLPTPGALRSVLDDPDVFRLAPVGRTTLTYGWAAPLGLQLVSGYEPYNLRHYQEYMQLLQWGAVRWRGPVISIDVQTVTRWDLLDALNTKYVLAPVPAALPAERFELLGTFPRQPVFVPYHGLHAVDLRVYRNRAARPRAFWAARVVPAQDTADAAAILARTPLDATAVVQDEREAPGSPPPAAPQGNVRVAGAHPGHLALELAPASRAFLVISEIWHPGWRARLDGRPVRLQRANLALMGLWVPPGPHRLTLEFRPLLWKTGLALSLACLAGVGGLLVRTAGAARRSAGASGARPGGPARLAAAREGQHAGD